MNMPTDLFLRVAQAKKVELKLGPKTYKLNEGQRKHMRALAGTIEHPAK